jgi:hypothetical protein
MDKRLERHLLSLCKQNILANENLPRRVSVHDVRELINKGYVMARSIMPDHNGSTVKYKLTCTGINRLYKLLKEADERRDM